MSSPPSSTSPLLSSSSPFPSPLSTSRARPRLWRVPPAWTRAGKRHREFRWRCQSCAEDRPCWGLMAVAWRYAPYGIGQAKALVLGILVHGHGAELIRPVRLADALDEGGGLRFLAGRLLTGDFLGLRHTMGILRRNLVGKSEAGFCKGDGCWFICGRMCTLRSGGHRRKFGKRIFPGAILQYRTSSARLGQISGSSVIQPNDVTPVGSSAGAVARRLLLGLSE